VANLIPSALKKFKLIDYFRRVDYGNEYALQILKTDQVSFIQTSVSWCECGSNPYLHITMGGGKIFGLLFIVYKFGFDLDIMSYTWKDNFIDDYDS